MNADASPTTTPRYHPAGALPAQTDYRDAVAVPAFPFASFGKRLLAAVVDAAIATAIMLVPVALGVVAIVNSVGTNANGDVNTVTNAGIFALGIVAIVAGVLCALLYEPLLFGGRCVPPGRDAEGRNSR